MSSFGCSSTLWTRQSRKRGREPDPDADGDHSSRSPEKGNELNYMDKNASKGPSRGGQVVATTLNTLDTHKSVGRASVVMYNEVVMTKVAVNLPVACLMTLRHTGTTWNRCFIPQVRKKHAPVYLSKTARQGDTRDFVNVLKSSRNTPFAKYWFRAGSQEQLDYFLDFISKFGHTVRSLDISWDHESITIAQLTKMLFATPELTELDLTSCNLIKSSEEENAVDPPKFFPRLKRVTVYAEHTDPIFTQLASTVIQCAKELEYLDMSGNDRTDAAGNSFVGPIFTGLRHKSVTNIQKLKTLVLNWPTITDLQVLLDLATRQENSLRLDSLSIILNHLTHGVEETGLIHDFLEIQASTLKQLKIIIDTEDMPIVDQTRLRIPRMEKLTKLKLITSHGLENSPFDVKFKDRATTTHAFPELKRLTCYCDVSTLLGSFRELDHLHQEFTVPSRVVDLRVRADQHDYSTIPMLSPFFPSLTRLKLAVTLTDSRGDEDVHIKIKKFAKIWTAWPALTSVRIVWTVKEYHDLDFDIDSWITGVIRGKLERLKHKLESLQPADFTMESLRVLLDEHKTRASIIDLKHLKELSIKFEQEQQQESNKHNPELTDLGGYFGIALAPVLQRIDVRGTGSLVTDECRKFIRNTFGPWAEITL